MDENTVIDFAISYAGEDGDVALQIARLIRQHRFSVFLADQERNALVGEDGEAFLARLYNEAKQVIVIISQHYVRKQWPLFEWGVIQGRDISVRCIPVRIDDASLPGLSDSHFYIDWVGHNLDKVVDACVKRLLLHERAEGFRRDGLYNEILRDIATGSRGALSKAYQLVKDQRQRPPLEDAEYPLGLSHPCYTRFDAAWNNFGVVRRRRVKVILPIGLTKGHALLNLKHCCISEFNAHKPDAVSILGYWDGGLLVGPATIAVVEFAPFGDWSRAEEGVAYGIGTKDFDFRVIEMERVRE